jgi:hypothetical protein
MTPSFSGLGVQVIVAEVALASVATTLVGVLGDFGPVSSPHEVSAIDAAIRAAAE